MSKKFRVVTVLYRVNSETGEPDLYSLLPSYESEIEEEDLLQDARIPKLRDTGAIHMNALRRGYRQYIKEEDEKLPTSENE